MPDTLSRLAPALALALSIVATSCAGDVDLVDRVQPDFILKSDMLDSHWYYRRTVVDAPETLGPYAAIGTGDWGTIERIRWDIQEEWLIALRDYEWTPGAGECEYQGSDCVGTPVASFPITSHFDIIIDYNPATGEKGNVRREDTSENPWFDRQYMRVNWSTNGNPNIDFIIPVDFIDTNSELGGNFYVHPDDASNPWHARITPDRGYIDFVVNHFVMPDPYTCFYEYDFRQVGDALFCGAGEVRVRHAFMKTDPAENKAYDPLYFPDSVTLKDADGNEVYDPQTGGVVREEVFGRFGYYRLDRLTHDDVRGLTESGRLYRATRFHIWQRSVDENGSTIPYADRVHRPIVYYLNWDFPEEMIDAAVRVANEWNISLQRTVAALLDLETDNFICDENGDGTPDPGDVDCDLPQMFILKRNTCNLTSLGNYLRTTGEVAEKVTAAMGGGEPTLELLDNWCAATEYYSDGDFGWQQIGDPRFNMMVWITHITPVTFAGYGPMLADPITGRIVNAAAFVQGWTIESGATRTLEYVDYINGELTLDDLLLGSEAPNVFDDITDPAAMTFSTEDVFSRASASVSQEHLDTLATRMQTFGPTPQTRLTPLENSSHFAERLARIRGTALERDYLTRPEDLMVASRGAWLPGQPIDDQVYADASLVTRAQEVRERRDRTLRLLQEHTMCPLAELDDAMLGLAKRLKNLGLCPARGEEGYSDLCVEAGGCAPETRVGGEPHPAYDPACVELSAADKKALRRQMRRQWIREAYFRGIMLHEIGHNLGLRHNFEGSYDALNYIPEFWDQEAQWGPTISQAVLDAKLAASQPEYMYSSIMDYHGKRNGNHRGLGPYDDAAIKFGYGQLLERFDDASHGGEAMRDWLWEHDYRELMHPSGIDGHEDSHPPYFSSQMTPDASERLAIAERMRARNPVQWDWTNPSHRQLSYVQTHLASEVPYRFCSDDYRDRTPTCKIWDFGANQRELAASHYVSYKNYFLFTNFLRYRLVLNWGVLDRSYRIFRDTNVTYKYMYLYSARDDNFQAGTDLGSDMATAVGQGMNLMSEVLAMPRPTRYYRCVDDGAAIDQDVTYYSGGYIKYDALGIESGLLNPNPWATNGDDPYTARGPEFGVGPQGELCFMLQDHDMPLGDSFPLFFGFSEDYVAWTFTYLGTYWDKQNALLELTDPLAVFFRENQQEDIRSYSISMLRLYPDEVNDIMLNLIEYDRKGLASSLDENDFSLVPKAMVTEVAPAASDGLPKVIPAMARNLQLYSMLFGMAFLSSPYDETLDFSKYTRIALKGSPEDFSAFEEANSVVVECTLPEAGRTYRALQTASQGSRIDIAYNFVVQCNDQLTIERSAMADYEAKQAALEAWEAANGGPDSSAQAWLDLYDEADTAWLEWEFRDFELRQTEQAMMFMRELNTLYEYGVGY